jgi:hypothetical protein
VSRWRKTKTKCRQCGVFYYRATGGVTSVAHEMWCNHFNLFRLPEFQPTLTPRQLRDAANTPWESK